MKSLAFKFSSFILLSVFVLSCTKTADDSSSPSSLKDALTSGTQKLNTAMTDIASNQAFKLLSISNPTTLKAATVYSVNIPLSLVAGVYNFKALKNEESEHYPLIKFFTKTPDASKMVINMPLAKLKNLHDLREYHKADSSLTNNLSMSVTEYYNNYNSYRDFDYSNVAAITIDNALAGSLDIKSLKSPTLGTQYASQFAFSNGYTAKYKYTSGDPIVSSFTILKAASVLYEETLLTIKNDTARFGREHQYSLVIGDVKLVKKADRTYAVYVKNVLQPKAVVSFIDKDDDDDYDDDEHSICDKRDIQITFEDGTTSTLSTLIGQTITDISTLFKSLHQVYYAASVADWIGYDIYYKR
jgi:hypothetical protein